MPIEPNTPVSRRKLGIVGIVAVVAAVLVVVTGIRAREEANARLRHGPTTRRSRRWRCCRTSFEYVLLWPRSAPALSQLATMKQSPASLRMERPMNAAFHFEWRAELASAAAMAGTNVTSGLKSLAATIFRLQLYILRRRYRRRSRDQYQRRVQHLRLHQNRPQFHRPSQCHWRLALLAWAQPMECPGWACDFPRPEQAARPPSVPR